MNLVRFVTKQSRDIKNTFLVKAEHYNVDTDYFQLLRVYTSQHLAERRLHPMGKGNNQIELHFK